MVRPATTFVLVGLSVVIFISYVASLSIRPLYGLLYLTGLGIVSVGEDRKDIVPNKPLGPPSQCL